MFVECPACEEQFAVDKSALGQATKCPACGRAFQPTGFVDRLRENGTEETSVGQFSETVSQAMNTPSTKRRAESAEPQVTSPPPLAESSTSIETPDDEINMAVPAGGSLAESLSDAKRTLGGLPGPSDFSGPQPTLTSRINTRRHQKSPLIMSLIAITGLVAIFGVVFIAVHQINRLTQTAASGNSESEKVVEEGDVEKTVDENNGKNNGADSNKSQSRTKQKAEEAPVTKPLPEEKPETYSLRDFERIWSRVYSYMVRLEIENDYATREASGFIIDSRGWVATSYNAIKDAKSVNVTLAARDFDNGIAWREKSDRSLGVVAVDAARDLAIIAINRDLVMNFTDLAIDAETTVVPGNRLILVRTPTAKRRLWLLETRIAERKKFVEMTDELKSQVAKDDERDEFERWLLHSHPLQEQFRGAALLDKQGQVVAINSSLKTSTATAGYALPIKHLIALKKSASGDLSSFSDSSSSSSEAVVGEDTSVSSTASADDVSSEKFEEIADLKRSFEKCKQFQFVGRDAEEIEQVELFVDRLKTALDYSLDTSLKIDERDELNSACEKIIKSTESVVAGFGGELSRRIAEMNDMMLLELDKEKIPVALICDVIEGAATSPGFMRTPTVTLRAQGTSKYFFVTLEDDTVVMPPGKTLMLFGYADPKSVLSAGGRESTRLELLFGTEVRDYGGQ